MSKSTGQEIGHRRAMEENRLKTLLCCQHWPTSNYLDSKRIAYRALARNVLAVAVVDADVLGTWKCYVGAVPGDNHDEEQHEVHAKGTKQPKDIAEALFPGLASLRYGW
jgi:hypothetical protein